MLALLFVLEVGKSETPRSPNNDLEFLYAPYILRQGCSIGEIRALYPSRKFLEEVLRVFWTDIFTGELIAKKVEEKKFISHFRLLRLRENGIAWRALRTRERKKNHFTRAARE